MKIPYNRVQDEAIQRHIALCRYSGSEPTCHCCGETIEHFLTFDHMGLKIMYDQPTRKMSSVRLVRWLLKSYRSGIRVSCFNCNLGREKCGGICPHKVHIQAAVSMAVGRDK